MKKIVTLILALSLALSLAACGSSGETTGYKVGIPADATNGARALLLLEAQGQNQCNDLFHGCILPLYNVR